jgi:hypothetical protein
MMAIAPISCNRCPPNITTGSRERGANLSTRYSGIFAADGSTGSWRSSSDFGIQHPKKLHIISLCASSGEPGAERSGSIGSKADANDPTLIDRVELAVA